MNAPINSLSSLPRTAMFAEQVLMYYVLRSKHRPRWEQPEELEELTQDMAFVIGKLLRMLNFPSSATEIMYSTEDKE